MEVRKTWFSYLALFLFIFGMFYILICGVEQMGAGQEYPFFAKGKLMLILAVALVGSHALAILGARLNIGEWSLRRLVLWRILEGILVCGILAASFWVRVWYIRTAPMIPESDYKTYYEIAQLLNKGTLLEEGKGYCDYVAIFPHVLGYSAVLAAVFRTFGQSVLVGQMFNVFLAVGTCFFCWGIARLLTGRLGALVTLAAVAFWPSMWLYNNFLAAEYLFSFLMYGCLWLALYLAICFPPDSPGQGRAVVLHIVLGAALACTAAIRPMALLLLVSILICLAPSYMRGQIKPKNEIPICSRIMEKGWLRALIILMSYLVVSSYITKCVAFTVDRDLAGGTASMGYNLLVGLNLDSYGGWNEEDSAYLYSILDSSGSAEQAQIACRDLAFQRLRSGVQPLADLFMHKYTVLWANDDYGVTWNIIFLDQHGDLSPALERMLYTLQDWNNIWYLTVVFFSGLAGIYLIKGRGSWSYILVLLFCGTVAMHLVVENQNRYHFHCLYAFAILMAVGLHELYEDSKYRVVIGAARKREEQETNKQKEEALRQILAAQEYARQQQEQQMSNYFDMNQALEGGHIKVSVSESYKEQDSER